MRIAIITVLIISSALFAGCKGEKSIDDLELVIPKINNNYFTVTLDVIVKKDDTFSLYYTEDGSIDFSKIPPLWIGVKGSNSLQQIIYTLPKSIEPTQLRLDFGTNEDQGDIVLQKVKFGYDEKQFEAEGPNIFNYFRADDAKCTVNTRTGAIKAIIKDDVRQFPSLYPHEVALGKQIQVLTSDTIKNKKI